MDVMVVKVVSSFWVRGEMVEPGDVVELPKSEAKALVGTGQAAEVSPDDLVADDESGGGDESD